MAGVLGRWVGAVGEASPAAALWLGAIALAMVGTRQPARRCALARAGLVGALILIPLGLVDPLPRLDLAGPLRAVAPPSWSRPPAEGGHEPSAARLVRHLIGGRWTPRGLALAYLVGFGANLGWLVLGWWGMVALARRSSAPSRGTLDFYATLPYDALLGRPRLRVSSRVRRPVLLGLARPLIVIPRALERPEARERLRLCLLHELAHAECRDPWFRLVGVLAQAAWFFLPPVWWIRAQLRLDQEVLADHRAADDFGPFGDYASSLVGLADPSATPKPGPAARSPVAAAGWAGSALFLRVLMLVRCPFPVEVRPPLWWRWGLPPITLAGCLLASTLTLRGLAAPAPPACPHGSFALGRLVLADRPYLLPISSPRAFDFTFEVFGDPASLARLRVAGQALRPSAALAPEPDWHRVHLHRDPRGSWLQLDAQTPERSPADSPPSLHSAGADPTTFRNLLLTW
ncbi:MAG TPA: M56 family metallopeptidase [Isosphaeraceae bacterium]|jgi:hypothetical protein|nr:M56 family metallopeptidase [Isosphaeraceae bacterium]